MPHFFYLTNFKNYIIIFIEKEKELILVDRVLIVVDAQEDFTRGSLRNEEAIMALPTIAKVLNYARDDGFYIWYTKDEHDEEYLNTQEGRNLPVPHCIRGTKGWEICSEVAPTKFEQERKIVYKDTFGAINGWLDFNQIGQADEIWLCGFCTDICVSANFQILKALFPEVPIIVISDACAGVTPELHEAALKVMKSCQAQVFTYDELMERERENEA